MEKYTEKVLFDEYMSKAVQAHSSGDYVTAVAYRLEAYNLAPDCHIDQGRAARDISASYDRLGEGFEADADEWAQKAYDIHNSFLIFEDDPSREVLREFSVTAMYKAVINYRYHQRAKQFGMESEDLKQETLDYTHQAWDNIQRAKEMADSPTDQKVDQYEINQAGRVAAIEAVFGDTKKALKIGARAVKIAFMSESPKIETSTPGLSVKEVLKAKKKALVRGVGSLAVGFLSLSNNNKVNNAGENLASRLL